MTATELPPAASGAAPSRTPVQGAGADERRGSLRRVAPRAGRFLGRHRKALAGLGAWSLLESAQTFLGGYGVARALDQGFLAGDTARGLLWLAVAAVGALLGGVAVRGVFRHLAGLVEPLRDALVRRAVSRSLAEALADPARADSAAVSRITHQTEIARDGFAGLVLTVRSFLFTSVGAAAGLLALEPVLLLLVLPPLLAGLGLFLATLAPMAARQRALLDADEALAAHAGRLGEGLRDITACGAQDQLARESAELIAAEAKAGRYLARWAAVRTVALGIAGQLPVLVLLVAVPWLLRRGVSAGALLGALTYVTQALIPAVNALLASLGAAGTRLLVVCDRLSRPIPPGGHLDPAPEPARSDDLPHPDRQAIPSPGPGEPSREPVPSASPRDPAPEPARSDDLRHPDREPAATGAPLRKPPPAAELRGVSFAYGPGARPVIDGLDLVLGAGEHLAVVGPSGIGKSTLTALLAGVLPPREGLVLLDGAPIGARRAQELAAVRCLVPQQAYVFGGALRENLGALRPEGVPEAELDAAVADLGAGELVDRLGGYQAVVDPAALSAGERQLLALLRAHLSPAPLLILDEATCHLDPLAEARAEQALAARPGTLVVVAHRISSARRADRVLVLDGTRASLGTHAELLQKSALYRELVGVWDEYEDIGAP
ncbi:ABC transporter ATP-binding protein [Streptomyces albus]|uniref:ABC transporter ATP-binding protein n=1 Tax=Streptomyces albus (strain ATCC 21838 / DSM 41398 / FERM P-419 / JCM 4703 / NBRC 107858) TaxID=1081613 RepID=A0A0B5ER00_STRA4|nr:ABC transporter ATP-binding protein [Streptomyces albus]AOU79540.1 ABC transporter ATP-binding protein [Streptomyces albus]AYN35263.1 ABC transporter ATP-binding protein [Streptomyces albus]